MSETEGKQKKKENEEGQNQDQEQDGQDSTGTPKPSDEGHEEQEGFEDETPYEFSHPTLRGRSPREIEQLYQMQERAANELGARLTNIEGQLTEIRSAPRPDTREEEVTISSDEYFADPIKAQQRLMTQQIEGLKKEIKAEISAATQQFRPDPRDVMRKKYEDWDEVEPYVDELIRQWKPKDPDDPNLLSTLYFTAVGIRSKNMREGVSAPRGERKEMNGDTTFRGNIPQHRASSPPKPARTAGEGKKLRELTETERRLAREQGLSHEEYLDLQRSNYYDEKSGISFLSDDVEA